MNSVFGSESYSKYWTEHSIYDKKKLGDKLSFVLRARSLGNLYNIFKAHIDEWHPYRPALWTTIASMYVHTHTHTQTCTYILSK